MVGDREKDNKRELSKRETKGRVNKGLRLTAFSKNKWEFLPANKKGNKLTKDKITKERKQ